MAKNAEKERKALVDQMRRQQQAAERRRTLLVAGLAAVLVLVLVGGVAWAVRGELASRDLTKVGVTTAAASCDPTITDPVSGQSVHVGPGTNQPTVTSVKYTTVPPTSGEHFVQPAYPSRPFYTATDRPALEELVHNLEHGYTVAWYTSATPQAQLDELKKIADLVRGDDKTSGKFIVSAWDDTRGAFPAGRTVALAHWGAKNGYRQLCGSVSGAAIQSFVKAHPYTDSPEPNAA